MKITIFNRQPSWGLGKGGGGEAIIAHHRDVFSKTLVKIYHTTQIHIPHDNNLQCPIGAVMHRKFDYPHFRMLTGELLLMDK
jgi:hypothetical protein